MPPILVGGSGEKKTLQIVAKHADACNLFGSPETITRKLEVLFDHCKKVGRNYDTILKTKLSHVIIAKDGEEAERRVNERFGEMDKESRREFVIYGNPTEVLEQILIFKDVGINYLIVILESRREMESLEGHGQALSKFAAKNLAGRYSTPDSSHMRNAFAICHTLMYLKPLLHPVSS